MEAEAEQLKALQAEFSAQKAELNAQPVYAIDNYEEVTNKRKIKEEVTTETEE